MRIVELDGDFFRKCSPVRVAAPEAPYEVSQRAGHEKILLQEAQPLPHARRVVRVKHPREGFGRERLSHRADEITMTEHLKVEVVRCIRSPEAKRVDGLAAITDHRPIKRYAEQAGRLANDRLQAPTAHLEGTIQLDFNLLVRPRNLPRVLTAKPVVRLFLLPAITNGLLEDAVLVSQAVANSRELHRRH